jgi:hypothetical protein
VLHHANAIVGKRRKLRRRLKPRFIFLPLAARLEAAPFQSKSPSNQQFFKSNNPSK